MLGPLRVMDGAQPLVVPGRIGRLLLAALLARANRAVPVDVLSNVLWDDVSGPDGAKRVPWHVHKLRQRLGEDDRIVNDSGGYRIRASTDELDALRYEQLVKDADLARRNGDADAAADLLSEAAALWRGSAYRELTDHELLRDEATRLEHVRLNARQRRVDIELGRGNHTEILGEITALVDQYPLHEEFRAQLMLALYRSGRQSEALDTYQDVRRLLAEQLGLDPGPRLRELESTILTGDVSRDTEPRAAASPVPAELPADIGAFTGRRTELDDLSDRLAQTPVIVAISGAGGIGKSALAIHLGIQWRSNSQMDSCTPIFTGPRRTPSRSTLARHWHGFCGLWGTSRGTSPRRRSWRTDSGPSRRTNASWWSWTMPRTSRRYVRCYPPGRAVRSSSPAAGP